MDLLRVKIVLKQLSNINKNFFNIPVKMWLLNVCRVYITWGYAYNAHKALLIKARELNVT